MEHLITRESDFGEWANVATWREDDGGDLGEVANGRD